MNVTPPRRDPAARGSNLHRSRYALHFGEAVSEMARNAMEASREGMLRARGVHKFSPE
jgi:hypothetical protein